jgi:hypothetical protein
LRARRQIDLISRNHYCWNAGRRYPMGAAGRILLNTRSRDGYSELTSEPTATRRGDFYENATGSPQKDTNCDKPPPEQGDSESGWRTFRCPTTPVLSSQGPGSNPSGMLFNARQSSQETCADLIPDFGLLIVKDLQGTNSSVRFYPDITQTPRSPRAS